MKTSIVVPISIVIGGLIVAGALYAAMPKSTGSGSGNPSLMRPLSAADHILGNPGAKVLIVEYSDFDCQYCKGFDSTLRQLVGTEGASGDVAWVFRNFPLTEIHPDSLALAEAAECAAQTGGNDGFWNFAELLFKNQPADPSKLGVLAAQARLPAARFASCYSTASSTLASRIMADRQNAFDIGAKGTPYSLIIYPGKDPVVIDGAYPYDAVKQAVDQALGR